MKVKVFSVVVFLCLTLSAQAQYRIIGTVVSEADSAGVKECTIYLNNEKATAFTDNKGRFVFPDVPNGDHVLHFTTLDFQYHKVSVTISNSDKQLSVSLKPRIETLEEVVISDVKTDFGFTRLRSVENMGIYEGKKSEVIIPEQLVANVSTNNARQVYSRVAGLNIWENDGAGLQLSIGGRGLDPNRTANFNVRQNGYDISADALGYPESYYTPPVEGIGKIQIVRGAASLQYGTQFGGLVNFEMKKPVTNKALELVARQTIGSFGFYNAFTSVSGTKNQLSYYSFFQYKRGDGWRDNSDFTNHTFYGNINYAFTDKTSVRFDFTQMQYLAHQPGGLTDVMFEQNPRYSNRERNWFKVNWNLLAVHFDHKFSQSTEFNVRVFGLNGYRYAIGFRPDRVATEDDNSSRELLKGNFDNWGAEARLLKRYRIKTIPGVLLIGSRYYNGLNKNNLGLGSSGSDANFKFQNFEQDIRNSFRCPNENISAFVENIFYVTDKISITPGLRYEYIDTKANGYFVTVQRDLAGNEISRAKVDDERVKERQFLIAGLGLSYKPIPQMELYGNLSQNYRSITFNDIVIKNGSLVVDPNMTDEKGYSFDLGIRSDQTAMFSYDMSVFYLNYNNRIGEFDYRDGITWGRKRGNIGQAVIMGIEAYGEADMIGLVNSSFSDWTAVLFNNIAIIQAEYKSSLATGVTGNRVEFVPEINLKNGLRVGYKDFKLAFQNTFLSKQFTDATNSSTSNASAVIGLLPSYQVMDVSASYQFKRYRIEGSVNNLANKMYFTRRATGYPGPGILPSDGRSFYLTLQVKI